MAYNQPYGMPYGYQNYPYGNVQSNFNQPNYAQAQQQQQVPQNVFAFVNGTEGAKSYQMQPNQTIMLMDSENPIVYMKTSNNLGQATIRYFKLVETNENEIKGSNKSSVDYALKSELAALNERIDKLSSLIEKPQETQNNGVIANE